MALNSSIRLRTAYWWECPKCGAGNFCLPIPAELTREELQRASEKFKRRVRPGETVVIPDTVACEGCGEVSEVLET